MSPGRRRWDDQDEAEKVQREIGSQTSQVGQRTEFYTFTKLSELQGRWFYYSQTSDNERERKHFVISKKDIWVYL